MPSRKISRNSIAFLGIFTVNSGIFQGLGKPGIPMRILIVTAILDIILNILLIPKFGINGAAEASTVSFIFAGLSSVFVLWTIKERFFIPG